MILTRRILGPALAAILAAAPGCFVPVSQYNESLTQNRSLASQNRAQLAEIANLRQRTRDLTEQLARTEEQLARGESRTQAAALTPPNASAAAAPPARGPEVR